MSDSPHTGEQEHSMYVSVWFYLTLRINFAHLHSLLDEVINYNHNLWFCLKVTRYSLKGSLKKFRVTNGISKPHPFPC